MRSITSRRLARMAIESYALSALALVANFVGGIIAARTLAPAGRGETAAIAALTQNIGFIFALGASRAIAYRSAKDPGTAARLAATWTLFFLPLTALAVLAGELALPLLFGAQSAASVNLARVYLVTVALVFWGELTTGLLLGADDFRWLNILRFAQPTAYTIALIVLWQSGLLTVTSALVSAAGTTAAVQVIAAIRAYRVAGGFGPVDLRLGGQTLWYALRGHGDTLAGVVSTRLDLLIMPAYLAAASIGIYSVASNISLIVWSLATNFSSLVLPAAVRAGQGGARTVILSLQAVLGFAALLALGLMLIAGPALTLVYGSRFSGGVTPLRILLPGTALLAGGSVLVAGLYALNRPGIASLVQLVGFLITVVGLPIFLPRGGILAAAIVSTAAYSSVFVISLLTYKRLARVQWRTFVTVHRPVAPS